MSNLVGLVRMRFLTTTAGVLVVVAAAIFGWYVYNTRDAPFQRHHRRIQRTSLALGVVSLALAAVLAMYVTLAVLGTGWSKAVGGPILSALVLAVNGTLLLVLNSNYRLPTPSRSFERNRTAVLNAAIALIVFSVLFVVITFISALFDKYDVS